MTLKRVVFACPPHLERSNAKKPMPPERTLACRAAGRLNMRRERMGFTEQAGAVR